MIALLAFLALAAAPPDRVASLERKLLAPCCFKETVGQHQSEAATHMRLEIGRMVSAGKTDREIIDFYRARYGDEVLSNFSPTPVWAVFVPWILLLAGAMALAFLLRRMTRAAAAAHT